MNKPKIGDILFAVKHKQHDKELFTVKVESVGKKYFYCKRTDGTYDWFAYQISIERWLENTLWEPLAVFPNEKTYRDKIERQELIEKLRGYFDHWRSEKITLSLEDLREIKAITERTK